jgi:hypothetical protein
VAAKIATEESTRLRMNALSEPEGRAREIARVGLEFEVKK